MYIKKQVTDDWSFMTVSYLYMTIINEEEIIRVPRTPSQRDMRYDDWVVIEND